KHPRAIARAALRRKATELRKDGADVDQITEVLQTLNKQLNEPLPAYQVPQIAAARKIRSAGTRIVYPNGLQKRLGISAPTRWRWEKNGRLPPRDVFVGGEAVGWRPETLERAEAGKAAA